MLSSTLATVAALASMLLIATKVVLAEYHVTA